MVARRVREKAVKIAAHLLEVAEEDIECAEGVFPVKGAPDKTTKIQDVESDPARYTTIAL